MKVNLLIGDKKTLYNKTQQGTGEEKHFGDIFTSQLEKKGVEFNIPKLYSCNLLLPSKISHILHHFLHPLFLKKKITPQGITHIMFGEEASMLHWWKPSKKVIVTCLDLIPMLFPQGMNPYYAKFLTWCFKGLKKADHIIANSEFTKQEIHKNLEIPREKISVVYPPTEKHFKPNLEIPEPLFKKYNLNKEKNYILFVGALDLPRKNVKTLIKAFKGIQAPNTELLLVGHAYHPERIKNLKSKKNIHVLNNVSNKELPFIYNLAKIFVFPSVYEGFGLPPAEAMACGIPVITTQEASLPEVVGNAALQVKTPYDEKELQKMIETLLKDSSLRDTLRKKGLEQVKKFSWEQHVEKTYELYKKLNN